MTATVLVTGGHGTMGPWVVRALAERGARTVVLDVLDRPRFPLPGVAADAFVEADVRDGAAIRDALDAHAVTHVVHLAAIVGEACERDRAFALDLNATATARLLDAARDHGAARVVALSSKGVLGTLPARFGHPTYDPVPADHPADPHATYDVSKHVLERLVVLAREDGLSATALRLSTNWGPGKSGAVHAGLSFHSDLLAAAARGETLVETDVHPDQGFDLVYYADVGTAVAAACLTASPLSAPVYHVGGGRITRMAEFAAALEAVFPGLRVTMGDRFPSHRNVLLDNTLAREDFGYQPAFDARAALVDGRRILDAVAATARA